MGPTWLRLSKPVIAAVSGYAVAGGLELWADLRVAAETAVFGVFCRRWGVPLIDGGTVRLPRLIGPWTQALTALKQRCKTPVRPGVLDLPLPVCLIQARSGRFDRLCAELPAKDLTRGRPRGRHPMTCPGTESPRSTQASCPSCERTPAVGCVIWSAGGGGGVRRGSFAAPVDGAVPVRPRTLGGP
jgi:hypothetical protein